MFCPNKACRTDHHSPRLRTRLVPVLRTGEFWCHIRPASLAQWARQRWTITSCKSAKPRLVLALNVLRLPLARTCTRTTRHRLQTANGQNGGRASVQIAQKWSLSVRILAHLNRKLTGGVQIKFAPTGRRNSLLCARR